MQGQLASPQAYIDQITQTHGDVRVLDAGCGGKLAFELPATAKLTGIDISEESARRNERIDEIMIGDLQSYKLPPGTYDIIICCDVLEHLPRPDLALRSLFEAVNDSGIVVLALSNVFSLKGLLTKFTPHWFHVWILRTFLNYRNAGKPGFAPFPTFLRTSIAPRRLLEFCAAHEMQVVYFQLYEGSAVRQLRERSPLAFKLYKLIVWILNGLLLRTHDLGLTDTRLVVRRRPAAAAAAVVAGESPLPNRAAGERAPELRLHRRGMPW
jgi:SAM-dependent methyltransferase